MNVKNGGDSSKRGIPLPQCQIAGGSASLPLRYTPVPPMAHWVLLLTPLLRVCGQSGQVGRLIGVALALCPAQPIPEGHYSTAFSHMQGKFLF